MDEKLRQAELQLEIDPNDETALEVLKQASRIGKLDSEVLEDVANLGLVPAKLLLGQKIKTFKYPDLIHNPLLAVKFSLMTIYICLEDLNGSPWLQAEIIYPQHSSGRELEYHRERNQMQHIGWNPNASFGELMLTSSLKCAKDVIDAYQIPDFDYHQEWSMERYGWNGRISDVITGVSDTLYGWTPVGKDLKKAIEALLWTIEWPAPTQASRFGPSPPTHLQKPRPLESSGTFDDVLREILEEKRSKGYGFNEHQVENFKESIERTISAYAKALKTTKRLARAILLEKARKRLITNLLGSSFGY